MRQTGDFWQASPLDQRIYPPIGLGNIRQDCSVCLCVGRRSGWCSADDAFGGARGSFWAGETDNRSGSGARGRLAIVMLVCAQLYNRPPKGMAPRAPLSLTQLLGRQPSHAWSATPMWNAQFGFATPRLSAPFPKTRQNGES